MLVSTTIFSKACEGARGGPRRPRLAIGGLGTEEEALRGEQLRFELVVLGWVAWGAWNA
jgi:hypothetical protein